MRRPTDDPLPPPTKAPAPQPGFAYTESAKSQRIQRTSYDNPNKPKTVKKGSKRAPR